jgi:hypothetical protein
MLRLLRRVLRVAAVVGLFALVLVVVSIAFVGPALLAGGATVSQFVSIRWLDPFGRGSGFAWLVVAAAWLLLAAVGVPLSLATRRRRRRLVRFGVPAHAVVLGLRTEYETRSRQTQVVQAELCLAIHLPDGDTRQRCYRGQVPASVWRGLAAGKTLKILINPSADRLVRFAVDQDEPNDAEDRASYVELEAPKATRIVLDGHRDELLRIGLLATATVRSASLVGTSPSAEPVLAVFATIAPAGNQESFRATVLTAVPPVVFGNVVSDAQFPCRYDPDRRREVAIDFGAQAPLATERGSSATDGPELDPSWDASLVRPLPNRYAQVGAWLRNGGMVSLIVLTMLALIGLRSGGTGWAQSIFTEVASPWLLVGALVASFAGLAVTDGKKIVANMTSLIREPPVLEKPAEKLVFRAVSLVVFGGLVAFAIWFGPQLAYTTGWAGQPGTGVAAACIGSDCRGQFQPSDGSQVQHDLEIDGRAPDVGRPFAARLSGDTIYVTDITNTLSLLAIGVFVVCALGVLGFAPLALTVATLRFRRALTLAFVVSTILTMAYTIGLLVAVLA